MQRGEVVPSTPFGNCKPARHRQNGIKPDGFVFNFLRPRRSAMAMTTATSVVTSDRINNPDWVGF